MKNLIIKLRLALCRALFPALQGGTNWGGTWTPGTGYTFTSASAPAYTFADPKYIRITEASTFTKILVTLAGATQIFGKRNKFPTVELAVADDTTVANLAADPPVTSTCTLVPPTGTTRTITARCVSDSLGQIEPEGEIVRILVFQGSSVWS